jgi:acyl phosphate:glycerol-3-phosphate acyltransferase
MMNNFTTFYAIIAYLVGAIPTGYIIAKLKGISDIRQHGSGNIGATNVSRVLGTHYFFLIFFLDAGKAYLFMQALKPYFDYSHLCLFAGILLVCNGCSIFLRGSGGKGVATLVGLLLALNSTIAFRLFIIWSLQLLMTKTVGIASVGTIGWLPFFSYKLLLSPSYNSYNMYNPSFFLFSLFATVWIIYTHRSNIMAYWNR